MSSLRHSPLLGRLVVRIYLVCLAQLLVVMAGVAILLKQSRIPESWLRGQGEYVVGQIFPVLHDQAGLEHALTQLRETAGARMTLYRPDRTLLATNVEPALPLPFDPAAASLQPTPPLLVLPLTLPPRGPHGLVMRMGPPRPPGGPVAVDVPMRLPEPGEPAPPPGPFPQVFREEGPVRLAPGPAPFSVMVQAPRDGPPFRAPLQGWAVLDLRAPT
ncbi:MAG TPA: hypothetical protein VGK85_08640, partial [Myxococcaceae bacterium]